MLLRLLGRVPVTLTAVRSLGLVDIGIYGRRLAHHTVKCTWKQLLLHLKPPLKRAERYDRQYELLHELLK